jgi:hypothetical protein
MSFDKRQFIEINPDAFVYKNFIDAEYADILKNDAYSNTFTIRDIHPIHEIHGYPDGQVHQKISRLMDKSTFCSNLSFVNTPEGLSWAEHTDLEAYDNLKRKKIFGGIIYLENFEGGEVYYPETNTEYHPSKGDMIIHSSKVIHGVREVKSKSRYTINFHLWGRDVV